MPRASATVFALVIVVALGVHQWSECDSRDEPVSRATLATARGGSRQQPTAPVASPVITSPAGAVAVEQRSAGTRPGATLVSSFDGLGAGFEGPQGRAILRNPSDNSLAVGPNHIMQTVKSPYAVLQSGNRIGLAKPGTESLVELKVSKPTTEIKLIKE